MVRQAIRQTYTYYSPEEPQGRVVEDAPLAGHGRTWTLGAYKHPVYPSPLNVRVGRVGIHVWMVINWLKQCDGSAERLLEKYRQVLAPEDVDAAQWYYEEYKDWIDQKLADET